MSVPYTSEADAHPPGEEIRPLDALIRFSRMLDEQQVVEDQETTLPVHLIRQVTLLLLDYRRTLEPLGAQVMALPLPQREIALEAYQNVCQRAALVLSVLENVLKDRA
jgi:hypothetical protein